MKIISSLALILVLGCNMNSIPKTYFDYDEVIHYKTNFKDEKIDELFDNKSKSAIDSFKLGVIIDEIPESAADTVFIAKLKSIGFSKAQINKNEFEALNTIFREGKSKEIFTTSCIYIYRDILVFKKNSKTIGVAKICFDCMAAHIVGTLANTEDFGQDGNYSRLAKILNK